MSKNVSWVPMQHGVEYRRLAAPFFERTIYEARLGDLVAWGDTLEVAVNRLCAALAENAIEAVTDAAPGSGK